MSNPSDLTEQITAAVTAAFAPLATSLASLERTTEELMERQQATDERIAAFMSELLTRLSDEEKDDSFQKLIAQYIEVTQEHNQTLERSIAMQDKLERGMRDFIQYVNSAFEEVPEGEDRAA